MLMTAFVDRGKMMDVASFRDSLRRLSADDIRRCAARLLPDEQCVSDQVTQWRAELAIDRLIRRHCTRAEAQRATAAAQRTARVVVEVARQRGMSVPDGDVSRVARTAGQIARGLALGALAGPFLSPLLTQFDAALQSAASPVLTAA